MADTEKEDPAKGDVDKEILEEARKALKECIDEEEIERAKMRDDLRFCTLDQWPAEIRREREDVSQEGGPRPCLTIDKINQYIVQVVNDMRQGKPGINVRPQDDQADVQTAKILKGLIRNIEDQSKADIAYATAGESAAKIGLGYFRITTEYVSDESFKDQEIFIRPIANTFAVYLGKHTMPDGSDAKRGFIIESMPLEKFKSEHPKAKSARDDFDELQDQVTYWHTGDMVTVVEYFCLKRVPQKLLFLADGTTMSEADYGRWPKEAGGKPQIQDRRDSFSEQLKWSKMTGVEVLDKRDLPGKYIPIVEVVGREAWVDGRRILWGLVRPAKDSLRMYNYFASAITEKMGLAPKNPFVGAKGQFDGLEDSWKKANRTNRAYLEYNAIDVNGNAIPAPQRVGPTPMEAALVQQMQVIEHDVQTSLGMFKAAVGETESQQSGRAILALQRESDTGTYHFGANQGISIRHAGVIIADLIPHYYDTKRVARIIGDDGEIQSVQIDPEQKVSHRQIQTNEGVKNIYNPGVGKFDISLSVGPSYNTKRLEAQATFVEMAKGAADPASAAVLRYLVMRNSDSAGGEEAAKLLKTLLPPQAMQALESKEPIPPQAMMKIAQLTQAAQGMQQQLQEVGQENVQLKAGAQVQMQKVAVDAKAKEASLASERETDQARLVAEREKAAQDIALRRAIAQEEAKLAREIAEAEHGLAKQKQVFELEMKGAEAAAKRSEQQKTEEVAVAPKFVEALGKITESFAKALEGQQAALTLMAQAIAKPKTVTLGGIRRGNGGDITGASATVQ